jgi:hypothetical protein
MGFEGLDVMFVEVMDLAFDGCKPDYSSRSVLRAGSEVGHQPVSKHIVAEDIGAEEFAQDRVVIVWTSC